MPFSQTVNNQILNRFANGSAWTGPTACYAALSTTTPTTTGTNVNEPTLATYGYARQEVTAANWSDATTSTISNGTAVTFGPCTGTQWASGSAMTYLCLYDASSAGTFLGYQALSDQTKVITPGDSLTMSIGNLSITMNA